MYQFEFRTGKIMIDHDKCFECTTYACVKACSLYGRGILRIQERKPVLAVSPEEVKRGLCIEDLGCAEDCWYKGKRALVMVLPIMGLEEFKGRSKPVDTH